MGQWAIDPEEEDKRLQETGQYNAPEDANTQFDREVAEELAKESEGGDQRQVPLVVKKPFARGTTGSGSERTFKGDPSIPHPGRHWRGHTGSTAGEGNSQFTSWARAPAADPKHRLTAAGCGPGGLTGNPGESP